MAKYWCPMHLLVNWCLFFQIKSRGEVHAYQCALFIPKLLPLPFILFSKLIIFLYYTQRVVSCQDHPTSWHTSRQWQYIAVIRHVHHPSTYSTWWTWPTLSTPSSDEEVWGRECPSTVCTGLSGGNLWINFQPRHVSLSITLSVTLRYPYTSHRQSNLRSNSDAPYEPGPAPPDTKCHHLQRKRRQAKRAQWPLCPRLEVTSGQIWPRPPPLRCLSHRKPSARWGHRWTSLMDLPDLRGQARWPRGPPPPGKLGTVAQQHQWYPLHWLIQRPLCRHLRWSHHKNNVVKDKNWAVWALLSHRILCGTVSGLVLRKDRKPSGRTSSATSFK